MSSSEHGIIFVGFMQRIEDEGKGLMMVDLSSGFVIAINNIMHSILDKKFNVKQFIN